METLREHNAANSDGSSDEEISPQSFHYVKTPSAWGDRTPHAKDFIERSMREYVDVQAVQAPPTNTVEDFSPIGRSEASSLSQMSSLGQSPQPLQLPTFTHQSPMMPQVRAEPPMLPHFL